MCIDSDPRTGRTIRLIAGLVALSACVCGMSGCLLAAAAGGAGAGYVVGHEAGEHDEHMEQVHGEEDDD